MQSLRPHSRPFVFKSAFHNADNELVISGISPMAQTVKNLPAMQETRVQSLYWEDALEEGMATHSSILGWRIPWAEEPGGPWSTESQSQTRLSDYTFTFR